jgi:translation elongation factor EF-1beta
MVKVAVVTIQLVPESEDISREQIAKEIIETLSCDWLLKVDAVKIENET